jgi:hypothetical protein
MGLYGVGIIIHRYRILFGIPIKTIWGFKGLFLLDSAYLYIV